MGTFYASFGPESFLNPCFFFQNSGAASKSNKRDKPKDKPPELPGGRFETPIDRNAVFNPISSQAPSRNSRNSALDLQRLRD